MLRLLILFHLMIGVLNDDWTKCPRGCSCSWSSGKRTAHCEDADHHQLPIFPRPDKIQVLVLNHNPLKTLEEVAFRSSGLINLQKVYLQNCSIESIHPTAFAGLVIMIELDLSHNLIPDLEVGTFEGNIRIRKLWLSHNPLRRLDSYIFPSIPHLRILDLSHCRLTRLSRDIFHRLATSASVEVVHLNDNRFKRLNSAVFAPLQGRLKSLTLERNPWECDCRLRDFWKWSISRNLFSRPTACEFPPKLKGIPWDRLEISSLACPPELSVFEPMVTVSSGHTAVLACKVKSTTTVTEVRWVRSGIRIRNNTASLEEDFGQRQSYVLHSKSNHEVKWVNLTINNVQNSGAGGYTCVARNEGGITEQNVTLVYSESVTSYLDDSEFSTLLVTGAASGIAVFIIIAAAVIAIAILRRRRRHSLDNADKMAMHHHHHHHRDLQLYESSSTANTTTTTMMTTTSSSIKTKGQKYRLDSGCGGDDDDDDETWLDGCGSDTHLFKESLNEHGESVTLSSSASSSVNLHKKTRRLLAREMDSRKRLLEALVRDKNDTVV